MRFILISALLVSNLCMAAPGANRASGEFTEVTDQGSSVRIFRDNGTGKIWTDRMDGDYESSAGAALDICAALTINGLKWTLPSADDYAAAEKDGIHTSLPNMNGEFTTTTQKDKTFWHAETSTLFNGRTGQLELVEDSMGGAFRCISE